MWNHTGLHERNLSYHQQQHNEIYEQCNDELEIEHNIIDVYEKQKYIPLDSFYMQNFHSLSVKKDVTYYRNDKENTF